MTGPRGVARGSVPTGNTYDKYSGSNSVERRLMENFFRSFDSSLPDRSPEVVLEVGIGEGEIAARVARRYPGVGVIGLDLPDDELTVSWSARRLVAVHGDAAALPFPDRAFDLVLAIEVLEHVDRPEAALREISRVARNEIVLSVPREPIWRIANVARGKYWRALGNTPGHVQHWGKHGFTDLVGRHLDVVEVRAPFPWTMISARRRR